MKLNADQFNSIVHKIRVDEGWFEPVVRLVKLYYANDHGAGGSLHIVLDEGNLEDSNVDWCAGYAAGSNDPEGSDIANLMQHMTMAQRKRLYSNYRTYAL